MLLLCRLYALSCGACALATLVWAFGFLGGPGALPGIDGAPRGGYAEALAGNLILLVAFVAQHSLLARPGARRWLRQLLPASLLRCSYVLFAALALALLLALWQPMGGLLWDLQAGPAAVLLRALYLLGWVLLGAGLAVLGPADVLGLRQAWQAPSAVRQATHSAALRRLAPSLLVSGALLALFATPAMTSGRLLFALSLGGYLCIAIQARRAARAAAESIPTP